VLAEVQSILLGFGCEREGLDLVTRFIATITPTRLFDQIDLSATTEWRTSWPKTQANRLFANELLFIFKWHFVALFGKF
jgi:hypothetical protein